jgi:hypothetical protein
MNVEKDQLTPFQTYAPPPSLTATQSDVLAQDTV